MTVALWIIAICEAIRILQNSLQLMDLFKNSKARDNAYAEFIKSIKRSDMEFVTKILEEYKRVYGEKESGVDE